MTMYRLLFAGMLMLAAPVTAADRPNIILVMADDQGWGDMAYNGHPHLVTPHFDAMAREAIRLDHFYAAAPVCSPTRASVLTGRHPNRMGVFKWGHALRPQETTIAEALKAAGYRTAHFGKWHLGSVRSGSPANPGACGFDEWLSAENFYDNDPILSREGKAVPLKGESSILAVDAAIEFLKKNAEADKPLLAVVWFGSPHLPHRAVEEDRRHYKDLPVKQQHFLGEITGMDRAFGRLRGAIRELGLRDNTVLWYTSDNGGLQPVSSGGRGRKGSVYEGGLRVPALLEWPARFAKPKVVKSVGNSSDIFPTVLEMAGGLLPAQDPLDGVSLLPVLDGKSESRGAAMGFWDFPAGGISTPSAKWMQELLEAQQAGTEDQLDKGKLRLDAAKIAKQYPEDFSGGHAAWLDYPWKLHRIAVKKKHKADNQSERWELYHLGDDPMETKDLSALEGERVKAMKAALMEWQRSVVRSLNGVDMLPF